MKRLATAQVIEVVDGDTMHSMLDIGWGVVLRPRGKHGGSGTIRVVHPDGRPFDAPERKSDRGKEARHLVRQFVRPGELLEIVSHGLDDFGRTLGSVTWTNGEDWATTLTALGLTK